MTVKRSKQQVQMIGVLLIVLFIKGVSFSFAQLPDNSSFVIVPSTPHLAFEHVSILQGLSHHAVTCILQDQRGFLWFGTPEGLHKYDGYQFTRYTHHPEQPTSLSHRSILTLHEDSQGYLWVGTENGLNRFDPATEQCQHFFPCPDDPNSLSHPVITAILEDHTGAIWVGTEHGLNRFVPETQHFTHYFSVPNDFASLSHNHITALHEDSTGTLWIGTWGGGVNRFVNQSETFVRYVHNPNLPQSLSHDKVFSIYEDSRNILWVGTLSGTLNRFQRQQDVFIRHPILSEARENQKIHAISTICEDASGALWLGTWGNGLVQLDIQNRRAFVYRPHPCETYSLNDTRIHALHLDRSGMMWIGTWGGGVNKFDTQSGTFLHYYKNTSSSNCLNHDVVLAIHEDRSGDLWIGTWGGGLNRLEHHTRTFSHYQANAEQRNSVSHNVILALLEDQMNTLWIGTEGGGLDALNLQTNQFTHYRHNPQNPETLSHNIVTALLEDRSGTLWIGTKGGGLNCFERESGRFVSYRHEKGAPHSVSHDDILSLAEDQAGILWVGTYNGLNAFDRETGQFTRYQHQPDNPQSISHNSIFTIHEDQHGTVWIGTAEGVNAFHRTRDEFTHYSVEDGLSHSVVYGILEDRQGNLWLSTRKGISRFNPRTEIFINYDQSDGLQTTIFNQGAYHKNRQGEMFFGGINGLTIFNPERLRKNPYPPKMALGPIQFADNIGQQYLHTEEGVELSHEDNGFMAELVALHYAEPENNQYAYMLEGFDESWINSGTRRFISYTNLDPGRYALHVKGANCDGVWSAPKTALKCVITPPFWATWWFRALALLCLAAAVITLHYVHISSVLAKKNDLTRLVEEQTLALQHAKEDAEMANRNKSNFLANMTHELRTPLTAILGYTQIFKRDKQLSDEQRKFVVSIYSNGERLLQIINDILDLSRIELQTIQLTPVQLHLPGFLKGIGEMMNFQAQQKGLSFRYDLDPDLPRIVKVDERRLWQILAGLLSNAIKFTEQGMVVFRAARSETGFLPAPSRASTMSSSVRISFYIEDTGVGIPDTHIAHIFQPFHTFHGHQMPSDRAGASLAISRHLVRMMGGDLQVQSLVGQGSVFWFDIIVPEKQDTQSRDAPLPHMVSPFEGWQPVILIIDDIDDHRELFRKMLVPCGVRLIEAKSGDEAVKNVAQIQPDIIFINLFMRALDGFETTKQLRQISAVQDIPIIAVSAGSFGRIRQQSIEAGCTDLLVKPIRIERVMECLQYYLGGEWTCTEENKKIL